MKIIYINRKCTQFIIKLYFLILIPINQPKKLLQKLYLFDNEISLLIKNKDVLKVLNDTFIHTPSILIINGVESPPNISINDAGLKDYNVTIKWDYQLTDCSYMFSELAKIIEIDLSKFDFSKVKNMSHMFHNCQDLTNINFNNSNTSLVEDMSYLFYYCKEIKSLNLSFLDTSSVTNMEYMFYYNYKLNSLDYRILLQQK